LGEIPYDLDKIYTHLAETDLIAVTTSSQVYPAAAYVHEALTAGAHTTELNLNPSALVSTWVDERLSQR